MSDVIEYDPEADVLLVRLRSGTPADEVLPDNDVVLGLGEKGEVLYVEVWDASRQGLTKALVRLARSKEEKIRAILAARGPR